ncbi:PorV/PorQ family protein [Elusimicrobiota bacterium]
MKRIIAPLSASIIFMACTFGASFLFADMSGGEPGRFMAYGAGGRALAMGGAFYSVADDATAAYWNPAGLSILNKREFTAMYASLFADTSLGFMAYAHPTPSNGVFGFTYTQLKSDGFEKVQISMDSAGNILDIKTIGTFSDIRQALGLAWGKQISSKMRLGLSAKMVRRTLDTSSDSHISMDVTTLIPRLFPKYRFAFGLHNLVSMKSGDTDDKMPLLIRMGNNYSLIPKKLSIGMDFTISQVSGMSWNLGGEYWVLRFIAFRFGIQGDPGSAGAPREMNFGAGLAYQKFSLDLASTIHDLGLTTRISGSWRFGSSIIEKREDEVKNLIQQGFDALRAGNFLLALQKLNQALDSQPTNKILKEMVDRLQEVVSLYPQALSQTEIQAFVRKGVAHFTSGTDLKAAVNSLRHAFNKNVKDTKILALLNLMEKAAGVSEVTRKIEGPQLFTWIDQKVFDARKGFMDGRYDLVIRRCQDILDLEPNNTVALEILGSAFFMMDEKAKARIIWRRVMEIDPSNEIVPPFLEAVKRR